MHDVIFRGAELQVMLVIQIAFSALQGPIYSTSSNRFYQDVQKMLVALLLGHAERTYAFEVRSGEESLSAVVPSYIQARCNNNESQEFLGESGNVCPANMWWRKHAGILGTKTAERGY